MTREFVEMALEFVSTSQATEKLSSVEKIGTTSFLEYNSITFKVCEYLGQLCASSKPQLSSKIEEIYKMCEEGLKRAVQEKNYGSLLIISWLTREVLNAKSKHSLHSKMFPTVLQLLLGDIKSKRKITMSNLVDCFFGERSTVENLKVTTFYLIEM